MESPEIYKRKRSDVGDASLPKISCTPKNQKIRAKSEEFCLYKLYRESSPNFKTGQDMLEVGWGDSPEPLNVEQKFELNKNSFTCKKKLDTKESPKSSIPSKRRNIRSTFNLPSNSIIDVSKYVAEVQELSKNIMKEFNAKSEGKDLFEDNKQKSSAEIIENVSCRLSPLVDNALKNMDSENTNFEKKDPAFDNVLQTFINEEDDWLSQALSSQEVPKTPHKSFVKSKSENEIVLPKSFLEEKKSLTQSCRLNNNNNSSNNNNNNNNSNNKSFRRTSSCDLTKPNNNYNNNLNRNSNQYSLQEIERKRLEAKFRRERREIERKKLEALKKLEMKKLRVIKT